MIVARPASIVRAGEEVSTAAALAHNRVKISMSIASPETFEGADVVLASPDLAFVGTGLRTSPRAAEAVKLALANEGFAEVHIVQTTYGCGHLDGVLSVLGGRHALVYPKRTPYVCVEALNRHGFKVLELPDANEATHGMAINIVPINEETVLLPAGNPRTTNLLERLGLQCLSTEMSELMKMGGAVHCVTGVIARG